MTSPRAEPVSPSVYHQIDEGLFQTSEVIGEESRDLVSADLRNRRKADSVFPKVCLEVLENQFSDWPDWMLDWEL